jgi:hypothetical protein
MLHTANHLSRETSDEERARKRQKQEDRCEERVVDVMGCGNFCESCSDHVQTSGSTKLTGEGLFYLPSVPVPDQHGEVVSPFDAYM